MQQPVPAATPNSWAVQSACDARTIERVAWDKISWDLNAVGPTHGAILVERARTFGGKLPDLSFHRQRLKIGLETFGWDSIEGVAQFDLACSELIIANRNPLRSNDISVIVLFAPLGSNWHLIGYVTPLPQEKLSCWYGQGTSLFSTSYRVIPNRIFPTSVKHRSRIHYWLADRQVSFKAPHALALLESDEGIIGDTSVANVIVVGSDGRWSAPSSEHAHRGTTLDRSRELLREQGVLLETKDLTKQDLLKAEEVILVGTTGVVWSASSLDGERLGTGSREHVHSLQTLWKSFLGFDFLTGYSSLSTR